MAARGKRRDLAGGEVVGADGALLAGREGGDDTAEGGGLLEKR